MGRVNRTITAIRYESETGIDDVTLMSTSSQKPYWLNSYYAPCVHSKSSVNSESSLFVFGAFVVVELGRIGVTVVNVIDVFRHLVIAMSETHHSISSSCDSHV